MSHYDEQSGLSQPDSATLEFNSQGCRGYGDSHGYGYDYGMGMGTVMNPHGFCG